MHVSTYSPFFRSLLLRPHTLLCLLLSTSLISGCEQDKNADDEEESEKSEESEEDSDDASENEDSNQQSEEDNESEKEDSEEASKDKKSEKSEDSEKSEESEEPEPEKSEEPKESKEPEESEKSEEPEPEPKDRDCDKIQWGNGRSLVEGEIIPRTDAKGFVDKDGDNVIEETETDADMCQLHMSGRKCGFIIYGDTG